MAQRSKGILQSIPSSRGFEGSPGSFSPTFLSLAVSRAYDLVQADLLECATDAPPPQVL